MVPAYCAVVVALSWSRAGPREEGKAAWLEPNGLCWQHSVFFQTSSSSSIKTADYSSVLASLIVLYNCQSQLSSYYALLVDSQALARPPQTPALNAVSQLLSIMRFRKQLRGASDQSSGLDTDSAFSDDASSMLSGSESSTSSASVTGQSNLPQPPNVRIVISTNQVA